MKKLASVSILLHDIRSVHNVGSIFRTADAFGVSKIHISGYTPSPKDRFGRIRPDIAKVALGAEMTVPWDMIDGQNSNQLAAVEDFIIGFKKLGGIVVVLEQDPRSIPYNEVRAKIGGSSRVLLVLGNEVGGVDKKLIELADVISEIPMRGKKESLNVSVAAGIALFALL